MATQTDRIQTRIDPSLKEATEAIFAQIGLSSGEAIRLFYKQVLLHDGLPFPLKVPNEASLKALKEAQTPKALSTFESLADFKQSLKHD